MCGVVFEHRSLLAVRAETDSVNILADAYELLYVKHKSHDAVIHSLLLAKPASA